MKKPLKYILISVGLIGLGAAMYFKFQSSSVEDNGLDPDKKAKNAATEEGNTSGSSPIEIGDDLYPSGTYVNVRHSANVNNGFINNIIQEVNTPDKIGVVIEILVSEGHTWYKVNLTEFSLGSENGFVRADVVTKTI